MSLSFCVICKDSRDAVVSYVAGKEQHVFILMFSQLSTVLYRPSLKSVCYYATDLWLNSVRNFLTIFFICWHKK